MSIILFYLHKHNDQNQCQNRHHGNSSHRSLFAQWMSIALLLTNDTVLLHHGGVLAGDHLVIGGFLAWHQSHDCSPTCLAKRKPSCQAWNDRSRKADTPPQGWDFHEICRRLISPSISNIWVSKWSHSQRDHRQSSHQLSDILIHLWQVQLSVIFLPSPVGSWLIVVNGWEDGSKGIATHINNYWHQQINIAIHSPIWSIWSIYQQIWGTIGSCLVPISTHHQNQNQLQGPLPSWQPVWQLRHAYYLCTCMDVCVHINILK